ncbi:uncharacterized protein METZ01_LOCUS93522 [marine metagenome]|uniref:Uncharacterized protein n=1 Tax=marine metagenome TaxID=408172 RepID=A0A381VLL6_9ZZZZ
MSVRVRVIEGNGEADHGINNNSRNHSTECINQQPKGSNSANWIACSTTSSGPPAFDTTKNVTAPKATIALKTVSTTAQFISRETTK